MLYASCIINKPELQDACTPAIIIIIVPKDILAITLPTKINHNPNANANALKWKLLQQGNRKSLNPNAIYGVVTGGRKRRQ
jgi:hypothetical protein